mmetsp:Transcript_40841/g.65647  ORF Transcript_40841/g.65647 Transcript_40841/m.65647 type:complete len:97 (-) Transcript_40841:123-413(-)
MYKYIAASIPRISSSVFSLRTMKWSISLASTSIIITVGLKGGKYSEEVEKWRTMTVDYEADDDNNDGDAIKDDRVMIFGVFDVTKLVKTSSAMITD